LKIKFDLIGDGKTGPYTFVLFMQYSVLYDYL